jgi:hypothetical protein
MSHAPTNHADSPVKSSNWNILWIMLGLVTALVLIMVVGLLVRHNGYRQKLQAAMVRIEAANEPLAGAELNAYYAIPPGANDLTAEWLRVSQLFESQRGPALDKVEEKFPIAVDENSQRSEYGFINDFSSIPARGEDWPEQAAAEAYLKELESARQELHTLVALDGAVRYPIDFQVGFATLLPNLSPLRNVARVLSLEFKVAEREGNSQEALNSLLGIFKTAETLRREPMLISQLVRYAILGIGLVRVPEFLQLDPTEEQLLTLQNSLAAVDLHNSLQVAYLGERATMLQTLRNVENISELTGGGNSISQLGPLLNPTGNFTTSRPGDCAKMLELLTDLIEAAKLPYPQNFQQSDAVEANLNKLMADEKSSLPWDRHLLTSLLIPSSGSVSKALGRAAVAQHTAAVAIAVERYRLQKQAYPEKLADLESLVPAAYLLDPITGKPLLIKQDAAEVIIYSVGQNGSDDSGDIKLGDPSSPDMGVKLKKKPVAP